MHLLVFLAALVAALLGILMLVFGGTHFLAPLAANPLIVGAVTWLLGAVILFVLGVVAARLRRLADTLDVQRVARAPATLPPPPPARRPDEVVAVPPGVVAADRDEGGARGSPPDPAHTVPVPMTSPANEPAQAETAPAPLSAAVSEVEPVSPARMAAWPRIDPSDRIVQPQGLEPKAPPPAGEIAPAVTGDGSAPAAAGDVPPQVLKSGVIEGMAYTLYSDGSIEAELPVGIVHFGSVAEWRAHMQAQA